MKTSLKNDIGLFTCPLFDDSWRIHSCGCRIHRSPSSYLSFPFRCSMTIWKAHLVLISLLSSVIQQHFQSVVECMCRLKTVQMKKTKKLKCRPDFPLSRLSLSFFLSLARSLWTNLTSFFGYPSVLTDDWSGYRRSVGLPGPCSFPSWWVRHGSAF